MSKGTDLHALGEQLRRLDDAPVHTHPDELEGVHRTLVSELESLAGAGSVRGGQREG